MKINRAYATMVVKSVDDEKRQITGFASTPETDRQGDIVEPLGASFRLPIPLLWQHDHSALIGQVISAKVTKAGIEIVAQIAKATKPSGLVARLDEAWESIKTGLVRGLSIGFGPLEYEELKDHSYRFIKWDWHELSAVTIPANARSNIQTIKAYDTTTHTPLSKKEAVVTVKLEKASSGAQILIKKESGMTITEQIKAFEAKKKELQEKQLKLTQKSTDEWNSLNTEEGQEFDEAQSEIESIDKHLKRLAIVAKSEKEQAKPVDSSDKEEAS